MGQGAVTNLAENRQFTGAENCNALLRQAAYFRPVTPEVAGSSPVARAMYLPEDTDIFFSLKILERLGPE